jgi:hypothetical protein
MAFSEDEQKEIEKIIRKEMMDAASEIRDRFEASTFPAEVKNYADNISQFVYSVLQNRFSRNK